MYFLTMVSAVLVSTASAASDTKKNEAPAEDQPGWANFQKQPKYFTMGIRDGKIQLFMFPNETDRDDRPGFELSREDGKSIWNDFHQSKEEFGLRLYTKDGNGIYRWIDAARFTFTNELAKVSWKSTLVRRFNELQTLQIDLRTRRIENGADKKHYANIAKLENLLFKDDESENNLKGAVAYMEETWLGEQRKLRNPFLTELGNAQRKDISKLVDDFESAQNALLEQQKNEIVTLQTKIMELRERNLDAKVFKEELKTIMQRRHVAEAFNHDTWLSARWFGKEKKRRRLMDAERIRQHALLRELADGK